MTSSSLAASTTPCVCGTCALPTVQVSSTSPRPPSLPSIPLASSLPLPLTHPRRSYSTTCVTTTNSRSLPSRSPTTRSSARFPTHHVCLSGRSLSSATTENTCWWARGATHTMSSIRLRRTPGLPSFSIGLGGPTAPRTRRRSRHLEMFASRRTQGI